MPASKPSQEHLHARQRHAENHSPQHHQFDFLLKNSLALPLFKNLSTIYPFSINSLDLWNFAFCVRHAVES